MMRKSTGTKTASAYSRSRPAFAAAVLALLALACSLGNRPNVEQILENPDDEALIDAYMDRAIDEFADADSCAADDLLQARLEEALASCSSQANNGSPEFVECMDEHYIGAIEEARQRCGLVVTATPAPVSEGALNRVGMVTEARNCSSEQEGHFTILTCDLVVDAKVEYTVPQLPAHAYCQAKHMGLSAITDIELVETSGEAVISVVIEGFMKSYGDSDGDGAADAPPGGDGVELNVVCRLTPSAMGGAESAWASFACPAAGEGPECPAPWVDLAGEH